MGEVVGWWVSRWVLVGVARNEVRREKLREIKKYLFVGLYLST